MLTAPLKATAKATLLAAGWHSVSLRYKRAMMVYPHGVKVIQLNHGHLLDALRGNPIKPCEV